MSDAISPVVSVPPDAALVVGIRGGRASVRRVLFMGTLTAVRMNPVIKAHYQQLRARGLAFKTAMVSCMRKLARILNAIVRDQKEWEPRQPKTA